MEVIYLTMTITVLLAGFFLYLFFANVKSGQYDDLYSPSVRMLFEDELVKSTKNKNEAINNSKEKELKPTPKENQ